MTVVGVIAEFNPFHSGHEFLLNQARLIAKEDPIIVVMAGNFVQRGDVAILDKWVRAKAALTSGADVVFELPFNFAVQPADIFAEGAMKLLQAAGVTDLVFGAEDETLNFDYLGEKLANIKSNKVDFNDYTQTYATQYNQMVANEIGQEVNQPNLMLALAYAVANTKLGNPFTLHPVQRIGQDHEQELVDDNLVMSASTIRNYILQRGVTHELAEWIPPGELHDLAMVNVLPTWNMMYDFLIYRLFSSTPEELEVVYQMNEGLQYKMQSEILTSESFTDFLRQIKSKRYTYARLRRVALYTVLNLTQQQIELASANPYLFLLGYTKTGQKYLKKNRKKFTLPVYSKVDAKLGNKGDLKLQVRTDRFFEQLTKTNQNFGRKPIEVK